MKYAAISVNDVDLPSSPDQSARFRDGDDRTGVQRPPALLAVFRGVHYKRWHIPPIHGELDSPLSAAIWLRAQSKTTIDNN
jgi:hypothetical protein